MFLHYNHCHFDMKEAVICKFLVVVFFLKPNYIKILLVFE